MTRDSGRRWFPFSIVEIEVTLAVFGVIAAGLGFLGASFHHFVVLAVSFFTATYIAGLFVHARREHHPFQFIEDGAVGGLGYLPYIRAAKRSLLLTHADDDAPGDELLALYKRLLAAGVEMRRVIFRRDGTLPEWVRKFGTHDRLGQRVVDFEQADAMRLSFVVIDDQVVAMSLPGTLEVDDSGYTPTTRFRHLVLVDDESTARAFLKMHRELWKLGKSITSEAVPT